MKENKLDYCDLMQSIDATKTEIENCEKIVQINTIVLTALKKALDKYPKPLKKPSDYDKDVSVVKASV